MDVEKLKQKILDLAIRGQLVPQDPDDEPASVLIEKIRAEKENLIKQGKIKRDKNESYIFKGDDNSYYEKVDGETKKLTVPFSIPDNWTWVRLGSIFKIGSSKRIHKSDWRTNGIPFYRARDIEDINEGSFNSQIYIDIALYESIKQQYGIPKIGDLLVTAVGTLGKVFIVTNNKPFYYKDGNIICFSNLYNINPFFIKMLFDTDFLKKQIKGDSKGTTVDTYTIIHANDTLIPMPSICEQSRIVSRYDEILTIASKIAVSKSEINELCKQLKVSILDFYFGTDSRYKSYSENMKDLGVLVSGRDLTPDCYNSNNNGIPYLTGASNFENDTVIVNRWTPKPVVISYFNDVLITCKGTIGKTAINQIGECHIARQIMAFRCGEKLFPEYVKMYFDYRTQELQRASSSLIPGISRDVMLNMEIPVPEIETQIQIVSRIKSMFALLGKIDS